MLPQSQSKYSDFKFHSVPVEWFVCTGDQRTGMQLHHLAQIAKGFVSQMTSSAGNAESPGSSSCQTSAPFRASLPPAHRPALCWGRNCCCCCCTGAQLSSLGPPLDPRLIGEPVGPVIGCLQLRDWRAELFWQAEAGTREVARLDKNF